MIEFEGNKYKQFHKVEVIFRRWNLIINMNNHIFLYLSPFTIYNRKISYVFAHFFDKF